MKWPKKWIFILKKSRTHLITHSETQLKCKTGNHNIGSEGLKEREKYVNKTKHFKIKK